MTHSSKNRWNELALFLVVTGVSVFALSSLVAFLIDDQGVSVDGVLVVLPSVLIGLGTARAYRRRRTAGEGGG
ncbi:MULTISPECIES: hypothetical protein [unclassified Streptomyces]|uniref:hypothetical protein n=1 Tax=unclassified Streptomyces TaxID=2593676 RepID=UPI0006AFAA39|nr:MULTISPECIES: hypothetical protein [unclassified Streptomyces]KOX29080.1 hypothetical protein ADL06_13030 [Streptomyces sp. NRRL F-6491]KOX43947.1 hypothetical protein ADL08_14410 [Streptomyces sp. NRRL F-6492]